MAEFISRLVYDEATGISWLGEWFYYITAFVERNPLSLFYSLMIVSFGVYIVRRILFNS